MTNHIYIHFHDAAWDESEHPRAGNGEFSAAQHAAAAAQHKEKQAHHRSEGGKRGEDPSLPPKGSHSEAASHHGSAAYYHSAAAQALDPEYVKKAHKASANANAASKKVAKAEEAGTYTVKKKSESDLSDGLTPQERQAKRASAYLSQRHIGPIKRR